MAKRVITLYVDDSSLRLLVAKGKKVKKWATLPLEPGLVRDGVIIDKEKVAAKIKELLQAQKVKARKVITGLSGLHCLSRPIIVPWLSKGLLAEAVKREAEKVMAIPLTQLYTSWQVISATGREMTIFLAAYPRSAADALIETLLQVGVKPYLMDLKPLALARVVKEATAIIVDVQPNEFDLIILVDGIPQPIRTIPLPSQVLSWQEKLALIRHDLDRTIKFYNSNNAEKPLTPRVTIFVSGELADEPELYQSLSDGIGYPVLPLSSPLKCPEGLAPSQYMVNIGLALKELPKAKGAGSSVVNLNALPEVYRPKPFPLSWVLIPLGLAAAIVLLVPLAMLVQDAAAITVSLQAQVDTTKHSLQQGQAKQQLQKKEIAELEKKLAETERTRDAFTRVLQDFSRQQKIVNGDLVVATSALPTPVLVRASHASVELTLSGVSPNEEEVLAYASALRGSGRFSQVIISHIAKTENGMTFTLSLKAKE